MFKHFLLSIALLLPSLASADGITTDTKTEWDNMTYRQTNIQSLSQAPIGGGTDTIDNGGLLLAKKDLSVPFWETTEFTSRGIWFSEWQGHSRWEQKYRQIIIEWSVYGQLQEMDKDWEKFAGNPAISSSGWGHSRWRTEKLPKEYSDIPNSPTLTRGYGEFEDKWLLIFNIGEWATKGWGMAVADRLDPFQRGRNPFDIVEPFPLTKATGGYNAPTEWMHAKGTWYIPDESRDNVSRMWTSTDLDHWTLQGPIEGITGHDAGMTWDGTYFYLFSQKNKNLYVDFTSDPLRDWMTPANRKNKTSVSDIDKGALDVTPDEIVEAESLAAIPGTVDSVVADVPSDEENTEDDAATKSEKVIKVGKRNKGIALKVGSLTGDPDIAYFNNRWHLFFNVGEKNHHSIAHASTSSEEFPYGWRLQKTILTPTGGKQEQAWDDDNDRGNNFGVGGADVAIEKHTLYMSYEKPVGIAYKNLNVFDGNEQSVRFRIEYLDEDDVMFSGKWVTVDPGKTNFSLKELGLPDDHKQWRVFMELKSSNPHESPLIEKFVWQ